MYWRIAIACGFDEIDIAGGGICNYPAQIIADFEGPFGIEYCSVY